MAASNITEPVCWGFEDSPLADQVHEVKLGHLVEIITRAERDNLTAFQNFTAAEEYLAEASRERSRRELAEADLTEARGLTQQHGQIVASLREEKAQIRTLADHFESRALGAEEAHLRERSRSLVLLRALAQTRGLNLTETQVCVQIVVLGRPSAIRWYMHHHAVAGLPRLSLIDAKRDVDRIGHALLGKMDGADLAAFGITSPDPGGERAWDGVVRSPGEVDLGLVGNAEAGAVELVLLVFDPRDVDGTSVEDDPEAAVASADLDLSDGDEWHGDE